MAHPNNSIHVRDDLLLWALVLSLALHSAVLGLLPGFTFSHVVKTIEPLTVELEQVRPPPPVVEPTPPKPPEPPKPVPQKPRLEKIPPKPMPQSVTPPPPVAAPQHNEPPPPVATAEPPKAEPPTPAVVAVEQKPAEPPPVFTAPVATSHPQPDDNSLSELRAAYGRQLREELAKHIKYPRVAEMKGWEGKVRVRLQVDKEGNVIGTPTVVESSGYKMLDDAAVKTVLNSSPLPLPPLALQAKPVPIETVLNYQRAN